MKRAAAPLEEWPLSTLERDAFAILGVAQQLPPVPVEAPERRPQAGRLVAISAAMLGTLGLAGGTTYLVGTGRIDAPQLLSIMKPDKTRPMPASDPVRDRAPAALPPEAAPAPPAAPPPDREDRRAAEPENRLVAGASRSASAQPYPHIAIPRALPVTAPATEEAKTVTAPGQNAVALLERPAVPPQTPHAETTDQPPQATDDVTVRRRRRQLDGVDLIRQLRRQ